MLACGRAVEEVCLISCLECNSPALLLLLLLLTAQSLFVGKNELLIKCMLDVLIHLLVYFRQQCVMLGIRNDLLFHY